MIDSTMIFLLSLILFVVFFIGLSYLYGLFFEQLYLITEKNNPNGVKLVSGWILKNHFVYNLKKRGLKKGIDFFVEKL